MIWFTADTHFNHANILVLAKRPFGSLDEMTEMLVERWNAVVRRGDTVYHLGDFALTWRVAADQRFVERLLARLAGAKHLVCGNHDRKAVKRARGWAWVGDYRRITVGGRKIVLFHYPLRSWHGAGRGAWHLFGHSHGNLPDVGGLCRDVGVDCCGFRPVSFEEVAAFMAGREVLCEDHHGNKEDM